MKLKEKPWSISDLPEYKKWRRREFLLDLLLVIEIAAASYYIAKIIMIIFGWN